MEWGKKRVILLNEQSHVKQSNSAATKDWKCISNLDVLTWIEIRPNSYHSKTKAYIYIQSFTLGILLANLYDYKILTQELQRSFIILVDVVSYKSTDNKTYLLHVGMALSICYK